MEIPVSRVFVQGDFHGHNHLWNHETQTVTAVLDFGESGVADPSYDFRYLPAKGPTTDLFLATATQDDRNYRTRHDVVDVGGSVTLRHKGKLHHIGIGCPYACWRVVMMVDGLDIVVLGLDGSPLRHLTLDPSEDYQRLP